jgi:hypothetical protein
MPRARDSPPLSARRCWQRAAAPHLGWADHPTFGLYFGEAFRQFAGRPVNVVNNPSSATVINNPR